MNRRETVEVNGQKFTLLSVSITWYFNINDRYLAGKRNSAGYMNEMIKGVVVEPMEVNKKGLEYFEERGDIATVEQLIARIEKFLRSPARQENGESAGEKA